MTDKSFKNTHVKETVVTFLDYKKAEDYFLSEDFKRYLYDFEDMLEVVEFIGNDFAAAKEYWDTKAGKWAIRLSEGLGSMFLDVGSGEWFSMPQHATWESLDEAHGGIVIVELSGLEVESVEEVV